MSADFFARIIGMIIFAIFGWYFGEWINSSAQSDLSLPSAFYALFGAIIGMLVTPYISTRPARSLRSLLGRVSAETLFAGLVGLIVGLMVAALLAFPISLLPPPLGSVLPFVGAIFFPYFFISIFVTRQTDMLNMLRGVMGRSGAGGDSSGSSPSWTQPQRTVLLDTSVIIDGRIADVARTGFLPGMLLIPRFVLNELQYIADSADALRRQRGRRGMEVLSELQKTAHITVRISDIDVDGVREVDDKLVILARQLKCPILTNDYNLNRVAELQGVVILNINELANAVKSVVLPGEAMELQIIQEGKEAYQGVGYMDDGTMVVVENGNRYIGQTKGVTVTKVLQTAAGRMIFARPED
jgi:uncharacterized protein YacL